MPSSCGGQLPYGRCGSPSCGWFSLTQVRGVRALSSCHSPAAGSEAARRGSFLGKLEALAILLQKLKSEGRRVLILSQMVLMLDILEMFLNFHYLTYIRIDENANSEQRQVRWALSLLVASWVNSVPPRPC